MPNPVCISPLKFYDDVAKQSHRKSYAYGHISPLLTKIHRLPPFQFILPAFLSNAVGTTNFISGLPQSFSSGTSGYLRRNWNFSLALVRQQLEFFGLFNVFMEITASAARTQDNGALYCNSSTNKRNISFHEENGVLTTGLMQIVITQEDYDYAIEHNYENLPFFWQWTGGGEITFSVVRAYYNTAPGISNAFLYDAKTDEIVGGNRTSELISNGFSINTYQGYKIAKYNSNSVIFSDVPEGLYYLKIASANELWHYYSEVFCFTEVTQDLIEIEYWNETGDFNIKNGIIAFVDNFHFKLLLKSELGKPEYSFEEESTKRLGYVFVESQVSKKTYKFNTVVPEYICDALRLVRLCDNKIIRCKDDEYEAITFEMEAEWQTQGDLASVTCEFETDNVVANIGGFVPDKLGGDYNNDYNGDFDKE